MSLWPRRTGASHNLSSKTAVLSHGNSIFKLTAAYKADPYPNKINLGVGAYRDDNNKPWVLPVVKKVCDIFFFRLSFHADILQASQIILNDAALDHEYLPITGLTEFVTGAARLILGQNSPAIAEGRVVSVQTISGTGANHLGALFLSRYYHFNGDKVVYLSDPTWGECFTILWPNLQTSYVMQPITLPYSTMSGSNRSCILITTRRLLVSIFLDSLQRCRVLRSVQCSYSMPARKIPQVSTQQRSNGRPSRMLYSQKSTTLSLTPLIRVSRAAIWSGML